MPYTEKTFKEKLAKVKSMYQVGVFSESLKKKLHALHTELDSFQNELAKKTNKIMREMEYEYLDKEIDLIENENKKSTIK